MIVICCLVATWSSSNVGSCSHMWAVIFVHRHSSLYVGSCFHSWVLVFVCGCSFAYMALVCICGHVVIVHCLLGVALWVVGIGGGSLTWHLVPVGVKEIEWEGEVSTYCGWWQCLRHCHHQMMQHVRWCVASSSLFCALLHLLETGDVVLLHRDWCVEAYSGSCGQLWVLVVICGGGDKVAWGGCVGQWWWEEKHCGLLIVDVTNSHLQNLLTSFLGRRLHSWYVGYKTSIYNKAFMVWLVEYLCIVLWLYLWGQEFNSWCCAFYIYYIITTTVTNWTPCTWKFLLYSYQTELGLGQNSCWLITIQILYRSPSGVLVNSYWNDPKSQGIADS